jgi:redox-sensitive bicupin YhaK (pirin superfamily)
MLKARKTASPRPRKEGPVRKDKPVRLHDVTLEVGSSIVIDPSGERLTIKKIGGGRITFEQESSAAHP